MTTRIFAPTFAMLLFTGACGDDVGGPDDSSGTAGATTTDGTGSTTDHSPTSTTDSTTGVATDAPPTTSSASDGETTTVATTNATTDAPIDTTTEPETTTGGVDPDVLSVCEAYCGRWDECGLQPDLAGCVAGCADNHSGLAGECKQASLDLFACTAALNCDELLGSGEPGGPCSAQEAAMTAACAGDECARSVSGGNDECEVRIECPEAPLQQMICDDQTCTCLEGGETVGACAAEGVCAAGEGIFDMTARCCGF